MTENPIASKDHKKGTLIVFEGIDGSGKSTQARRIYGRLKGNDLHVSIFTEPTGGMFGKTIRKILCGELPRRTPQEELELFVNDRKEDVSLNIKPALKRSEIVLVDRYYYSTIAYQGAMGLDIESIREQNQAFAPLPDLVLIFLISVKKGLERIRAERMNGEDNYEKRHFLIKVDQVFRSLKDPQIEFIDGEMPLIWVNREVDRLIDAHLMKKGYML